MDEFFDKNDFAKLIIKAMSSSDVKMESIKSRMVSKQKLPQEQNTYVIPLLAFQMGILYGMAFYDMRELNLPSEIIEEHVANMISRLMDAQRKRNDML